MGECVIWTSQKIDGRELEISMSPKSKGWLNYFFIYYEYRCVINVQGDPQYILGENVADLDSELWGERRTIKVKLVTGGLR